MNGIFLKKINSKEGREREKKTPKKIKLKRQIESTKYDGKNRLKYISNHNKYKSYKLIS